MESLISWFAETQKLLKHQNELDLKLLFPTIAIVVINEDPEYRRRIKVADPLYGGKVQSNWVNPIRVTENSDPPLPKINQSVIIFYIDGDPEKGYYLPLITDTNPSRDKESPINDDSYQIEGNRDTVINKNDSLSVEGNQDIVIGGESNLAIAGQSTITIESDKKERVNATIDISATGSITIRNDSGAFINLSGSGIVVIQDAFGRKITLGGGGGINSQWDLNNFPLEVINATSFTINNKEIATVGAVDTDGDTLVSKGW